MEIQKNSNKSTKVQHLHLGQFNMFFTSLNYQHVDDINFILIKYLP